MDKKNEFQFSEHVPDTTTKHYFAKEELGEGVVSHDKFDPSMFMAYRPVNEQGSIADANRIEHGMVLHEEVAGKGVALDFISRDDLPVGPDGKLVDMEPPRGMYRDKEGNFRDLRELRVRELVLGTDVMDGSPVKVIKGLDADYDGISLPLRKPTRAQKSLQKYRNVMIGLIARAAKK